MKTVLIVNEICSDNIGDHAINEGIRELARENGYTPLSHGFDADKKNVVPVNKNEKITPKVFLRKLKNLIINRIRFLKYFRWYLENNSRIKDAIKNDFSLLMIGGGQLIQSGGTFPIAMFLWACHAKVKNKPYIILGVGCAEKFNLLDRLLFKYAFNNSEGVYVRERRSIEKLDEFFNYPAKYIPDLAFALYGKNKTLDKTITIIGATAYYVYLKNAKELEWESYKSQEEYVSDWTNIVEEEIRLKKNKILFISTTVEDAALNSMIYHKIKSKNPTADVELFESVPELNTYIQYLSASEKIYSGRMHSLILGKIQGNELEPWLISKKIEYFMEEYGGRDALDINRELKTIFSAIIKKLG